MEDIENGSRLKNKGKFNMNANSFLAPIPTEDFLKLKKYSPLAFTDDSLYFTREDLKEALAVYKLDIKSSLDENGKIDFNTVIRKTENYFTDLYDK